MINICQKCGLYRPDKIVQNDVAICPECHHEHPFLSLPLFIICGPSGAGKTTVCERLTGTLESFVVLDSDILWHDAFKTADNGTHDFFELWLRVAKNIGQSGRPVVLFSSGGIPQNVEPCIERRYFSNVSYLALVCHKETHLSRLKARPAWRRSSEPEFIAAQNAYRDWFFTSAAKSQPPIALLDTSNVSPKTTAVQVRQWLEQSA